MRKLTLIYIMTFFIFKCVSQTFQIDCSEVIHFDENKLEYIRQAIKYANSKISFLIAAQDFEKIDVYQNKENEICVLFTNPVKYIPKNTSSYVYDLLVNLTAKSISYGPISNPKNFVEKTPEKVSLFKRTEQSEQAVQFVFQSINKKSKQQSGNSCLTGSDINGSMIIREDSSYYAIERLSEFQESYFKVEKNTGRIFEETHNHLAKNPEE
ncbi:MAG: hypothetical protein QM534_08190 [Sediminibacterium sp.]|nr:hypothetical protein [Sediminibacterium sp.]